MPHPLDNPVWNALSGPNAKFAIGQGKALHYLRDVTPFSAISEASDEAYADLAVHLPPDALARMFRPSMEPLPAGWRHIEDFPLLQMVAQPKVQDISEVPANFCLLQARDLNDMLELVEITEPGPFGVRTMELGTYLGVREEGRLIAMAGERMRVPGFVELSAICTHPKARGRGLAALLLRWLMREAFERGEIPFLHVSSRNAAAIKLYEKLGFELRKTLHVLRRQPLK